VIPFFPDAPPKPRAYHWLGVNRPLRTVFLRKEHKMIDLVAPASASKSRQCSDALDRAQRHLSRGDYTAAIAACTRAIELCSAARLAYLYRASAYELMGEPAKAVADYRSAQSLAE
jgi:Tfp pilus assembly protein PilF